MNDRELEDRIRASLQARAGDVQPTPALWERVSDRVTRRRRWQVLVGTLSGAAAVVALVVGIGFVLSQPTVPTIDPFDPAPPAPGVTVASTVVTTDGESLFEVDPATGEVLHELPAFEGFAEGVIVGDVAVRPGSGDELVVAVVIGLEGQAWEIEVMTFAADRALVDRLRVPGPRGPDTYAAAPMDPMIDAFPPTVAWSPDGTSIAWVRINDEDVQDVRLTVLTLDWAGLSPGELPTPVDRGGADSTAHMRMQAWAGTTDAPQFWMTMVGGGEVVLEGSSWRYDALGMEGGTVIDVAFHRTGTLLALVARPGDGQDAESATLELIADPMSDTQRTIPVPDGLFPDGTASPVDGWIEAAGDHVAVGFGDRGVLLALVGDTVEDLEVIGTVELPAGTRAAGIARVDRTGSPTIPQPGPTDDPTEEDLPGDELGMANPGATYLVVGVAFDDTLNVRRGPGPEFEVVTELQPTGAATATGRDRLVDSGLWFELEVDGVTGWANSVFLAQDASTQDLTSSVIDANDGQRPTASTMEELGLAVAELVEPAGGEEAPVQHVIVTPPTVGDLGEVTVDVVGLPDDSVLGWRLVIFATPTDDGFTLSSVEGTVLCRRGVSDGLCL
jgi:hypothetical protein